MAHLAVPCEHGWPLPTRHHSIGQRWSIVKWSFVQRAHLGVAVRQCGVVCLRSLCWLQKASGRQASSKASTSYRRPRSRAPLQRRPKVASPRAAATTEEELSLHVWKRARTLAPPAQLVLRVREPGMVPRRLQDQLVFKNLQLLPGPVKFLRIGNFLGAFPGGGGVRAVRLAG